MSEQEARERIIAWAKEHFTPISTAPEEFDLTPDVEVVSIYYEPEFDVWDAQLSVSSSLDNPYVTFIGDDRQEHGIYVSNVED